MNTEHTPGPWRVGNGSFVISDHPAPGITGSDDVQHYGGHLICESVSQANARLIAAAPDLLEAAQLQERHEWAKRNLESIGADPLNPDRLALVMEVERTGHDANVARKAAIAKAEGKA